MRTVEKFYPLVIATLFTIVFYFQNITIKEIEKFDSVLNGVITISSIIIAFMGTMVSILITLMNTSVMQAIKDYQEGNKLSSFISRPIICGLLLSIYCLSLYVWGDTSNDKLSEFFFLLFIFLLSYFVSASFRIYFISISILRNVLNEKQSKRKQVQKPELNDVWTQEK
ncbi:hypothetical protein ACFFGV_19610 [Pontibacillus salicampi]|uniref:DUF2254 domain-containing protein n=1 Tax=Pontibacillus salicampi TaxID=1449801 RepID=A0ABV6LTP9_9BACI